MIEAPDSAQRQQALDPSRSFIVQAPAGSGKTELLIQRFLRLLGTVEAPEQVIAITFTRKAAAEMRARVVRALGDARGGQVGESAHRRATLALADAVLRRDAELEWNLSFNPQRLRIQTLDALNAELALQLPLLSGGAAGAPVLENADAAYAEAARKTVEALSQPNEHLDAMRTVLREVDYNVTRLEKFLAGLLRTREQWVPHVIGRTHEPLEARLKHSIELLRELRVQPVEARLDEHLRGEVLRLTRHAYEHGSAATREKLTGAVEPNAASQWQAAASLLLTTVGQWRSRFTKAEGFGPGHKTEKAELADVVEHLKTHGGIREALERLKELPGSDLSIHEKTMLQAMQKLLAHALAELRVHFASKRVVDFVELAQAAQYALGDMDAPSDLLLALDKRIQHILVDEYQDTSQAQIRLLELLTAGWQSGDGRSVFLVGDPMQSIYRFRNADMSLFLRTRQYGLGEIRCEPLVLSANFRSSPAVVSWINSSFGAIFPDEDDIELGLAAFHQSSVTQESDGDDVVQCHALSTQALDREHARVVEIIEQERRERPDKNIAVLVQSRTHLAGFQAMLRARGWAARAVEIDALYKEQFVQDLLGLGRALTHVGDRLAWLAVLRAPWCGLTWRDMEALVNGPESTPATTIWELIHDPKALAQLSEDGCDRVIAVRSVLAKAMTGRAQTSFGQWLENTWRSLGGPEALTVGVEPARLDQFFSLLDEATENSDIPDGNLLEKAFEKPVRDSDAHADAQIDIMTIHRAKGLEFDTVILPGLNRKPRNDDRRLLDWVDSAGPAGESLTLLAPYTQRDSALARYIRSINNKRGSAERARVLYVAATRAKQRLHLVWGCDADKPVGNSLLSQMWSVVESEPRIDASDDAELSEQFVVPRLRRFSRPIEIVTVVDARASVAVDNNADENLKLDWAGTANVQIGIVVHNWLNRITANGLDAWTIGRVAAAAPEYQRDLQLLGVEPAELDAATQRVRDALIGVLNDPRGRWIIGQRELAESELTLSRVENNQVIHLRLDRTFVEDGIRWIVDYKTSSPSDASQSQFLDSEVERYRYQLESYADAMAGIDARPIRVGLYFPLLPAFRDWEVKRP